MAEHIQYNNNNEKFRLNWQTVEKIQQFKTDTREKKIVNSLLVL